MQLKNQWSRKLSSTTCHANQANCLQTMTPEKAHPKKAQGSPRPKNHHPNQAAIKLQRERWKKGKSKPTGLSRAVRCKGHHLGTYCRPFKPTLFARSLLLPESMLQLEAQPRQGPAEGMALLLPSGARGKD